jgi:hypothetical protein
MVKKLDQNLTMRLSTILFALLLSTTTVAQSNEPPCLPARERDEVKARIEEISRRSANIEGEIASLRYDTINIQPAERVQRIDSLVVIRSRGKEVLLELDRRLRELEND